MRIRILLLAGLGATACVDSGDRASTSVDESPDSSCNLTNASLVETDTAIVNNTNFSLEAVFAQIRSTTPTGITLPKTPTAMYQSLYAAFSDCKSSASIDPDHYGLSCRPPEASLATLDPFSGKSIEYVPVALVNRLDLAPADLSYCGESRIVFWKNQATGPVGRAAIIVEMKTPSVTIDGEPSCAPVADFWANLSSETNTATRTKLLVNYYFKGIAGTPAKPVTLPEPPISANGVGFNGAGQVRLNSFINFAQWNLREFKWQEHCTTSSTGTKTCTAGFAEQNAKNNPSQLLFSGSNSNAPAFQSWFVDSGVPLLADATELTQLALPDATQFNTFESVSEPLPGDPTNVQYASFASAKLTDQIQSALDLSASGLSVGDVLARATTQTCGGCHQVSNGASLGGGLTWPSSNGFTQIDETGTLSPALTGTFLPFRLKVLKAFACGSTGTGSGSGGSGMADAGVGVDAGGGGVDAGGGGGSSGSGGPPPPPPPAGLLTIAGLPAGAPN
jgi:hypothetical protein